MADAEQTEHLVPESSTPAAPAQRAEPIDSRFLFVDVAAQRAKQLRRGALPRLAADVPLPRKLERVAMEEVRQGYIDYTLPAPPVPRGEPR